MPDELHELMTHDTVDRVIEYQSPYADYSVILSDVGRVQQIRAFYLKEMRHDWEWVDDTDDGVGFVLLKRRSSHDPPSGYEQ